MFAARYFPAYHFAERYFPALGAVPIPVSGIYFPAKYFANTYFAADYFPGLVSGPIVPGTGTLVGLWANFVTITADHGRVELTHSSRVEAK